VSKPNESPLYLTASPVYLAAPAVNHLLCGLPIGTAYLIGVVLITLGTGPLVQQRGSLACAAWPDVAHLRGGWHRAERALARGSLLLEALFDRATPGCLTHLPAEPVRLGSPQRSG
jgi:hypothetical protein